MEERNKKILWASLAVLLLLVIVIILFLLFWPRYEVRFDTKGGSEIESVMVRWRGKVKRPEDPTREGYVFAGWYYEDEEFDFDTAITKNMVIEAEWNEDGAELEGIALNVTELTLAPGGTALLNVIVSPENAVNVELVWETSDESIVTVDQNGNITAVKEGTAVITVKTADGKYSATCTVTVVGEIVAVEGVEISGANEVRVGETIKLTAKVSPDNATNKQVTWSSSNKKIATVNSNGVVKGIKAGTVTITATTVDGQKVATHKVTVKAAEVSKNPTKPEENNPQPQEPTKPEDGTVHVTGVTISGSTHEVNVGGTLKLTAKVSPDNATNKKVTWSSSNPSVATVDQNGTVTGKAEGKVTITVTTEDGKKTATYEVTVKSVYKMTLTALTKETGAVFQYSLKVTKDGKSFTEYKGINYNGTRSAFNQSEKVPVNLVNTGVKTATIYLNNGSTVTATVEYK